MLKSIKNELYKSIHNKFFVTAMIIAFVIQLFSVQPNYDFYCEAIDHFFKYNVEKGIFSDRLFFENVDIYTFWISIEGVTMGYNLAKYLLPILAVLPFGWSFLSEQKSGYQFQTVCRIGKTKYFISKYIATFISGALPIAFLLLSNYAILALFCPIHTPAVDSLSTGIDMGYIGGTLFYENAFLFMLMWTGISCLWAGTLAGLTMLAAQLMKQSIFIMLFPFFITIVWDNICSLIINNANYSFLYLFFVNYQSPAVVFGELFVLFLAGFGVSFVKYTKGDVL